MAPIIIALGIGGLALLLSRPSAAAPGTPTTPPSIPATLPPPGPVQTIQVAAGETWRVAFMFAGLGVTDARALLLGKYAHNMSDVATITVESVDASKNVITCLQAYVAASQIQVNTTETDGGRSVRVLSATRVKAADPKASPPLPGGDGSTLPPIVSAAQRAVHGRSVGDPPVPFTFQGQSYVAWLAQMGTMVEVQYATPGAYGAPAAPPAPVNTPFPWALAGETMMMQAGREYEMRPTTETIQLGNLFDQTLNDGTLQSTRLPMTLTGQQTGDLATPFGPMHGVVLMRFRWTGPTGLATFPSWAVRQMEIRPA